MRGGRGLRAGVGDRRPATGGDNNLSDVFSLSTVSKQFSTLFFKKTNLILPEISECILKPGKVKEGEGSRQILCSGDK